MGVCCAGAHGTPKHGCHGGVCIHQSHCILGSFLELAMVLRTAGRSGMEGIADADGRVTEVINLGVAGQRLSRGKAGLRFWYT